MQRRERGEPQTCVEDEADARHLVDSLKAAGADIIKPRAITTAALYFAIAREARRQHLPFGGTYNQGEGSRPRRPPTAARG